MSPYNKPRNIQFIFQGDELEDVFDCLFDDQLPNKSLIVSDQTEKSQRHQIRPDQVNQFLGQEINFLFYNATNQFDVNQFVAIVGCLVGGGRLLLRLPDDYKDAIRSMLEKDNQGSQLPHPTHSHSSQLLFRFVQNIVKAQQALTSNHEVSNQPQSQKFEIEQELLIEKIQRCALGHAKRPLVITADRGRGKSTALAKASAILCYVHNKNIIITAPRKENLNIFFKQFNQELEHLSTSKLTESDSANSNSIQIAKERIKFIAIDKLPLTTIDHQFLIVDEAGSFPVQVLANIIKRFNRIAFASTTSGYEGNGRGFELKFLPILAKIFPQFKTEKLTIPFRWRSDDLLEDCCNRAFLLGQPSKRLINNSQLKEKWIIQTSIDFHFIEKEQLLTDDDLLSSIFSLLTEAHYQTRPSDLERMLTDPQLKVFIATDKSKQIVSACLVVEEGGLEKSDCIKISEGKLRLKGHLLPQSLISTKGILTAGDLSYWRIMRVAVTPDMQNHSIGTQMIKYVIQQAKTQNIDIVGTSFALSTSLFNFWNLLDFSCCRIALRTDSSTGLIPADFLYPLNESGKMCSSKAIESFNQSFVYSSSASYKNLDSKLLSEIMARQISNHFISINLTIIEGIQLEVKRYIEQARSFEMVEWQVSTLIKHYLIQSNLLNLSKDHKTIIDRSKIGRPTIDNFELVFAKTFQKRSWEELVQHFELSGKNEVKSNVRKSIKQIYGNLLPNIPSTQE